MIRDIRQEIVEYINRTTGIDKEVIIRVLEAEENYFVMQIRKILEG